jgi:hypothetical protein
LCKYGHKRISGKSKAAPLQAMKAYSGKRNIVLVRSASALDGREWSDSRPGRFTPRIESQCLMNRLLAPDVQLQEWESVGQATWHFI